MITLLKILGLLAALALGVSLGLGRFRQDPREIERSLDERGRRKRVHRHFTPLDLLKARERSSREGQGRSRFRTVAPERREDSGGERADGEAEEGPAAGGPEERA